MFENCVKLISVDLSKYNFYNVKKLNNMFSGCINLQYLSLPKNSSLNHFENCNFSEMFSYCTSLKSIDLSQMLFNGINNLNNIFTNCLNIESITLKGQLMINLEKKCVTINGEEHCLDIEIGKISIFPVVNKLRRLNLFDLDINLNLIELDGLNNLDECLYFEQYSNLKKCSKYIGFHHCGNCNNENNEYYCTKIIDGTRLDFYYLEHQLNQTPITERECYWSFNYTRFLIYQFIEGDDINYYKINSDSCEKYNDNGECLICSNKNGFYKIENNDFICSNESPAKNYVLDIEAKEWRQCNKRCLECYAQSRSEIYHQCLECNKYHYPYLTDYDNFINNKTEGYSCYTMAEVYLKYDNYFLNSNNKFEQCDISCSECETKNKCLICSLHYYYIYGNENGTCFKEPLSNYGLVSIDNSIFFQPCFELCKYCNKITKSYLYQQCSECDELNYTLDIYSYNQSLCIPKDNSNSYFI
jgi:hypothetical protein